MKAILELRDLVVAFDGFRVIDELDWYVDEGELRFLIGPNGAGKTTLLDVITGLTKPVSGRVRFETREIGGKAEHEIVRLGIGRTFQNPTVFESLTVADNVDLAASFRVPTRKLLRRRRGMPEALVEILGMVGLDILADAPAAVLSHGQRQWLEIAMLLAQQPRVLLLDEPVAGMTGIERETTGRLLQRLAEQFTVVVVEHDMEFLRRFARRVTVLHEGRLLSEGSVEEIQADPQVLEVYLGRAARRAAEPASAQAPRPEAV